MSIQRTLSAALLVTAFVATMAPIAHVLEMASKFTLGGALWLAIQQNLYRGWGPIFGPVEVLALVLSLLLCGMSRSRVEQRNTYFLAAACYAGMIAAFFICNSPVNHALSQWTAGTLPPDWPNYRFRWELGRHRGGAFGDCVRWPSARAASRRGPPSGLVLKALHQMGFDKGQSTGNIA